jgi:molybdopterin/thiamine biosynthesis adenylyltransferase
MQGCSTTASYCESVRYHYAAAVHTFNFRLTKLRFSVRLQSWSRLAVPKMKVAERLLQSRVHIGGCGRLGTTIALALHAAGVGEISCNDPQMFEEEQLAGCVFARCSDLGRPKVHVLERFLEGRGGLTFLPIVATNQSRRLRPYLEQANVIVSCANRIEARLHLERAAIRLGKPSVQAAVEDGRRALGGMISVWAPGAECSCLGCLLPPKKLRFSRGEILPPTVTGIIGSLAAHLVIQMLASDASEFARRHNVFAVDATGYRVESLSVSRRTDRQCPLSCRGAE